MGEQPPALIAIREEDSPEPAAVDSWHPVMPRQPFVDERIVRIQELGDAPILTERTGHEQLGLPFERLQQTLVIGGVSVRVNHHVGDTTQIQPLGSEIVHQ